MADAVTPTALREARHAAGLTQRDLARISCCSPHYVRLLERGLTPDPDRSPGYRHVIAALTALGYSPGES